MSDRKQIQIAQDLVRFINIMNDLLDCVSFILKEIDPQTGGKYQVQEDGTFRDATLDELKATAKRTGQNVLGYWNIITDFVDSYGPANVKKALLSLGIDITDIQNDLGKLETEARYLIQNIKNAETKEDLIPFAERIDTNIPKLVLIRRSWCLGL